VKKPIKSPVVWSLGLWTLHSAPATARSLLASLSVAGAQAQEGVEALPALRIGVEGIPGEVRSIASLKDASERDMQTVGERAVAALADQLRRQPVEVGALLVLAAWVSSHESKNRDGERLAYRKWGMAGNAGLASDWRNMGIEAQDLGFEPTLLAIQGGQGGWMVHSLQAEFCASLGARAQRRGWDQANGTPLAKLPLVVREVVEELLQLPAIRQMRLDATLPTPLKAASPKGRF